MTRSDLRRCPACGRPATCPEVQQGRWLTSPVVACSNKNCERHLENQRARQFWYMATPLERGRGVHWDLW